MKLSNLWKTLTRDQRRVWNAWAKSNPVLLDDGSLRRVSGHKAMTLVLRNRAIAGDAANPTTVPAAATWLVGALSLSDAGPFTTNAGYVGFRVMQNLVAATKWFVWATPPLDAGVNEAHAQLRFVKCLSLGVLNVDDLVSTFGTDYAAVHGSWDGPGADGAWPADKFMWLRVQQYANGQLGPSVTFKGRIQVEL